MASSERRARVEFARTMRQSLQKPHHSDSANGFRGRAWWARFLLRFVHIVALAGMGSRRPRFFTRGSHGRRTLFSRRPRPSPIPPSPPVTRTGIPAAVPAPSVELLQAQLEQSEADRRKLEKEIAPRPSPGSRLPLAFVLTPGIVRDEASPQQLAGPGWRKFRCLNTPTRKSSAWSLPSCSRNERGSSRFGAGTESPRTLGIYRSARSRPAAGSRRLSFGSVPPN